MRKTIIAGNWKMNMTPSQASVLASEIVAKNSDPKCEVVICVPFVDIFEAKKAIEGSKIHLGAQNVHFAEKGAYTGEISASMLLECGVEYVIIGHSERRQYFAETDETVNKRLTAALAAGLKVILCVGETEAQRDAGETFSLIEKQIKAAYAGVSAEKALDIVIAYEPVWAIGTGRTATSEQAEEVCAFIRGEVAKLYDANIASETTIQYGGSMNAKNAAELLAMENIDGGLIGGASLKSDDFTVIINAAE
ncbi:MAG: triose-phosphate isomerase [Ruminococcaceae bacterium]|nr:triose-phosphate isomerase [Oscillospiraceae bacterium]